MNEHVNTLAEISKSLDTTNDTIYKILRRFETHCAQGRNCYNFVIKTGMVQKEYVERKTNSRVLF